MRTIVHLYCEDESFTPSVDFAQRLLRFIEAGEILLLMLFDRPIGWDIDIPPSEKYNRVTVDECIRILRQKLPVVSFIDAMYTPWSLRMGEEIHTGIAESVSDGVNASTVVLICGPYAIKAWARDVTIATPNFQIAFIGDGAPADEDYVARFAELPMLRHLVAWLANASGGRKWRFAMTLD